MELPEDDFEVYDLEDSESQISGVIDRFNSGDRVIDLGAGRGRIALPLAKHGVKVRAVDRDGVALSHRGWSDHANLEIIREDFLAPQASWFEAGGFHGVACLGNTLNLIHDPDQLKGLFLRAADALAPGGMLLIDDFPIWGPEMIRTQWPLGMSPDEQQQVAWASDGLSFAYRTGSEVDSQRRYPEPGERLLRAWTLPELEKIAGQTDFGAWSHDESALMIVFARSD